MAVANRLNGSRIARLPLIAPETIALFCIGLLDLATTIFWMEHHGAAEGNPLMSFYLTTGGIAAFILGKLLLLLPPLGIAEWARRRHPRFVHGALRIGLAAYVSLYGLGVLQVNTDTARLTASDNSTNPASFSAISWKP